MTPRQLVTSPSCGALHLKALRPRAGRSPSLSFSLFPRGHSGLLGRPEATAEGPLGHPSPLPAGQPTPFLRLLEPGSRPSASSLRCLLYGFPVLLTRACTHTRTHCHTRYPPYAQAHTHTDTHTHSHTCPHPRTLTHTHTLTHPRTLSHPHARSHTPITTLSCALRCRCACRREPLPPRT